MTSDALCAELCMLHYHKDESTVVQILDGGTWRMSSTGGWLGKFRLDKSYKLYSVTVVVFQSTLNDMMPSKNNFLQSGNPPFVQHQGHVS
jgi:hypothetical protein